MSKETKDLIPSYNEPFRAVLMFGPPGSGKGTQGKFLSAAGNHFHLSSGDLFRGLTPESPAGKLFHTYATRGHLVPDEATISIWRHYVDGLIATNRYFPHKQLLLLDGIPRTLAQAQIMEKHIKVVRIIVLETQDVGTLVERLKKRALVERRLDDADEGVLRTRMEVYQRDTAKLLDYYPQEVISRFSADLRPLEVLRDLLVSLSDILS